jgi:two-component sensor histidine kinase
MQGRIRSMAIVHETLYRSGTFAEVDLHTYIGQVASNAFRALAGGHGNVRLVLALLPVRAGIEQATPCGLLVNELVSNALKHAFNEGQGGEVRVSLQTATDAADGAHRWCLAVSDTGTGLPIDFDARRLKSLGMQLVSDLCKQLAGNLTIDAGPGARFTLTFTILVAAATATAKAG